MAKDNTAKKDDNATTTTEMPTMTAGQNGTKMQDMQKQMDALKNQMATAVADEVVLVLQAAEKASEDSSATELPTPVSNYLTAKMASAQFMALRDELVSSHIRCENVQEDKVILLGRKERNEFRSDVEKDAADRSLAYYESLDERLSEVTALISDVVKVHTLACEAQTKEDDQRQQGVAVEDRTYVTMPELRWVSSADKAEHPNDWAKFNDIARMKQQAIFWMNYNS